MEDEPGPSTRDQDQAAWCLPLRHQLPQLSFSPGRSPAQPSPASPAQPSPVCWSPGPAPCARLGSKQTTREKSEDQRKTLACGCSATNGGH